MDLTEIAILGLAVARVSRFAVFDSGPSNILGKIRMRAGALERVVPPGSVAELLNCPWCVAFIVSMIVVPLYYTCPVVTMLTAYPLAVSFVGGAAVMLTRK